MNIERKYIDLKHLNVSEAGPGTIDGYRAVFGEIDEGGDLIVPGFFKESIVEYLEAGFTTHSHDWDFDKTVGYPLEAKEDDHGLYVKSEFHTTPDAQGVRQKAIERKKAGKRVGFSFGYSIKDKSYIEAKDYKEQLPLYVKPERLQVNLQKAQNFDRIRILKKGEIIEDAIVTAPMNKLAMASGVKSGEPQKGMLAEEMAQTTPSFWEVESAYCRVIRKIAATAKDANITGVAIDWRAKITDATSEFASQLGPMAIAQVEEFLDSSDDEFYLKGESVSGSFESFDAVVAAVEKHTSNMQRNHENRVKEGRILSASNRAKVQAAYDALGELLLASEPPPKEPAEKEIDMDALRTQSLRMQSLAIRALA